jgi:membrane protease YdiL (CAAX protease family)
MGRAGHAFLAIFALFFMQLFEALAARSNVSLSVIELGLFGAGLGLLFLCAAARSREGIWGRFSFAEFTAFMLAIIATSGIYRLAVAGLELESPSTPINHAELVAQLFGVAIVTPLKEEVIYRQLLFRSLSVSGSARAQLVPILGTSVIFALSHLAYWGTAALLHVAVIGVLLGWARAHTGGIALPLMMHIAVNTHAIVIWAL